MRYRGCYEWIVVTVLMAPPAAAHCQDQKIAPASGKAMCGALTAEDFTKAGVPVRQLREANLDDAKSAYCIYDGEGGKVEMDIYFPAGDTPGEAENAVRAAESAIGGRFEAVRVGGADEASSDAASSSGADASIVVRRATTVFNISIPRTAGAQQQLTKLSERQQPAATIERAGRRANGTMGGCGLWPGAGSGAHTFFDGMNTRKIHHKLGLHSVRCQERT